MEFLKTNWQWAALAVVSGALLLLDLVRNRTGGDALSAAQATLKMNREDAAVVDVRDQNEFVQGHIAGATNIPLAQLDKRIGDLEKFKGRPVILCCQSGARSNTALGKLKKAGFDQVFNLAGGLVEWEKAGQPISKKRK